MKLRCTEVLCHIYLFMCNIHYQQYKYTLWFRQSCKIRLTIGRNFPCHLLSTALIVENLRRAFFWKFPCVKSTRHQVICTYMYNILISSSFVAGLFQRKAIVNVLLSLKITFVTSFLNTAYTPHWFKIDWMTTSCDAHVLNICVLNRPSVLRKYFTVCTYLFA